MTTTHLTRAFAIAALAFGIHGLFFIFSDAASTGGGSIFRILTSAALAWGLVYGVGPERKDRT